MKVSKVTTSGELIDFFTPVKTAQAGGGPVGEFRVCYKINDDGSGITVVVQSPEGKHRGADEWFALRHLFVPPEIQMVNDAVSSQKVDDGWGDDPPTTPPPPSGGDSGQISGTEILRRRRQQEQA